MLGNVGKAKGINVVRLCKEDYDLLSDEGLKAAIKIAKSCPGAHVRGSLPCTPWSRWQSMNIHRYGKRFAKKLKKMRDASLHMLLAFETLAQVVYDGGGTISFEWPRYCDGWQL